MASDTLSGAVSGTEMRLTTSVSESSSNGVLATVEQHRLWGTVSQLPLKLRVRISVPDFRVANLVALSKGQVIRSASLSTEDLPVEVGNVQLGWGEFELIEQRLAIRLTRLM